jgi:uncharacterized membrane protein
VNEPWVIAAPLVATAILLAVAPGDELGFLLQFFGAGTVIGTLVAYRATRRNPERETFAIQVRWGAFWLGIGLIYMIGEAVIW